MDSNQTQQLSSKLNILANEQQIIEEKPATENKG